MVLSFQEINHLITKEMDKFTMHNDCPSLYNPAEYLLKLPGKRIRPSLVLISTQLCGGMLEKAIPCAIGTELFHNFSLMHDDIMDKASIRRGNPTVNTKWNVNQAILSGDIMLLEAYKKIIFSLEDDVRLEVFKNFTNTSIDVCVGQQMDLDFELLAQVTQKDYLKMITLKTASLIGFCLKLGGIISKAKNSIKEKLYRLGLNIGTAFQLKDDFLDTYGNKNFGKKIGGDIMLGKKTILLIKALERADGQDKKKLIDLQRSKSLDDLSLKEVLRIFEKYEVKKCIEDLFDYYSNKSYELCSALPFCETLTKPIFSVISLLSRRQY